MPAASRRANLWCGEGFSGKKKKGLTRERLAGTLLPFKELSRPSAHCGPSAGLATTVGQQLADVCPVAGIPATFITTPS